MKKTSLFAGLCALALLSAASCDHISIERNRHSPSRGETLGRERYESETQLFKKGEPVAVAVVFPDSYDWRRDSSYGAVRGRLTLYSGHKEVLSVDAGPGTGVSLDADRHHLAGDHLYTEGVGTDSGGTVYKRDGETVLEAGGREILKGLLEIDGALYTLSENASGGGFVLRKDWKELCSRKSGRIHGSLSDPAFLPGGALHEENGEPCFFVSFTEGDGGKESWSLFRGTDSKALDIPLGVKKIYDLKVVGDEVHLVCQSNAGRSPVLFLDGQLHDFWWTLPVKEKNSDFRLFRENGLTKVIGTLRNAEGAQTAHWSASGLDGIFPWDCSIFHGASYVSRKDGDVVGIRCSGKDFTLSGQWKVAGPRCVLWTDDGAFAALYPHQSGSPAIWHNGKFEDYTFNGFFSQLAFVDE